MPREKTKRPTDLMGASDIAEEYGLTTGAAQNLFRAIARRRGGPIFFEGVRRFYVYRSDVEASLVNARGASS